MNEKDFDSFIDMWRGAQELHNITPTDSAIAIAYKILSKYDYADVSSAMMEYLSDPERGKYPAKPSDIIDVLKSRAEDDGRPGADKAWSIAVSSFDENNTVVMNDEIGEALRISRTIYLDGDKTGARMAFRSAYEEAVKTAREEGRPVKWFPSLGHDKHGRASVLNQAVNDGLLPAAHVTALIPPEINSDGLKLMGKIKDLLPAPELTSDQRRAILEKHKRDLKAALNS